MDIVEEFLELTRDVPGSAHALLMCSVKGLLV